MLPTKLQVFLTAVLPTVLLGLSGCGGGGGGAQGSTSSGTSGSGTTSASITLSISPVTVPTNTLTAATPLTVKAIVKDSSGALVKNTVVTFSTGSGSGLTVFSPSSATAMTGDGTGSTITGEASIGLRAATDTPGGATTVIATAIVNDVAVTSTPIAVNVVGISSSGTPTLTLELLTLDETSPLNELTYGTGVKAKVTVKNGNNLPQPDVVVNFAADSALVTMTPITGSSKTNSLGVATITMNAASLTAAGAGYVIASATNSYPSALAAYSVGAPTVSLGTLVIDPPVLSVSGTAKVSVEVLVNYGTTAVPDMRPPTTPVMVTFSSRCTTEGTASLTPASINTSLSEGKATATVTYKDLGCGGSGSSKPASQQDLITATVNTKSTNANITVLAAQAANIQFISLTPATGLLVLKGTGGVNYSEVGNVRFQVVDNSGRPVSNQNVYFSLTTYAGKIQLDGSDLLDLPLGADLCAAPTTPPAAPVPDYVATGYLVKKLTDTDGFVSVNVQSGTVPTPVWVKATTCTPTYGSVSSQSNKMTITTGLPSQDFFSLSPQYLNIEGLKYDGEPTIIYAIVSDRLGNPVPDGTVINFIAEGAQVRPSNCSTESGNCRVTLFSAESRPDDARITLLAYALGEESFVDQNNNNVYDAGEPFDDLGDAYIDKIENWSFDPGEEQRIPFQPIAVDCKIRDVVTLSNAAPKRLEDAPWADKTCDGAWGKAHVRRSKVIVLSDSKAQDGAGFSEIVSFDPTKDTWTATECSRTYGIRLMDKNHNPMPVGSNVSIKSDAVFYTMNTGLPQVSATVFSPSPFSVPNTNGLEGRVKSNGSFHEVKVTGTNCAADPAWSGSFVLEVVAKPNAQSPRSITDSVNWTYSYPNMTIP